MNENRHPVTESDQIIKKAQEAADELTGAITGIQKETRVAFDEQITGTTETRQGVMDRLNNAVAKLKKAISTSDKTQQDILKEIEKL